MNNRIRRILFSTICLLIPLISAVPCRAAKTVYVPAVKKEYSSSNLKKMGAPWRTTETSYGKKALVKTEKIVVSIPDTNEGSETNVTYKYDKKQKLTKRTARKVSELYPELVTQTVTTYKYDSKGRLTTSKEESTDNPAGDYKEDISYSYNSKGLLTSVNRNRVVFTGSSEKEEIKHTYSKKGQRTKTTIVSEIEWDGVSRITITYSYYKNGELKKRVLNYDSGTTIETETYNTRGLITDITYKDSSQKYHFDYTYYKNSAVKTRTMTYIIDGSTYYEKIVYSKFLKFRI